MNNYNCSNCNYTTKRLYNYNKHLLTLKHAKNTKALQSECDKIPPKPAKTSKTPTKTHQNPPKFVCEFCLKEYTRNDSLKRHTDFRCKVKKTSIHDQALINQLKEEREYLKSQIEVLLTKVGNNNNNNITNNTININSYGNEDLSHITKTIKTSLLKIPALMIPKLVEKVHFNPDKPENHNLMIHNKKEGYISVYKDNKWCYKDKEEVIRDLVDGKYYILDEHYDATDGVGLNPYQKQNYETFRDKFDSNDKNIHKTVFKQCEMSILNNQKNT
jgi:hypothetical protein